MKPWCGHHDGISSDCEHVVVPMNGKKFLFIRVTVWCEVCKKKYLFIGTPLAPGQVAVDQPFLWPGREKLGAPMELEE